MQRSLPLKRVLQGAKKRIPFETKLLFGNCIKRFIQGVSKKGNDLRNNDVFLSKQQGL